jgi:hypothetical protein
MSKSAGFRAYQVNSLTVIMQLGEANAPALMDLFGYFYRFSSGLGNLLDRAELFVVSSDIKDQLVLALADLVTLVVSVAKHFHGLLLSSESVSVDIYSTFPGPIDSFRDRCEHASELIWRHQLMREGFDGDKGMPTTTYKVFFIPSNDNTTAVGINALKYWLQPEDPALAHVTESIASSAQEREEATCMWVKPHLTRFLNGEHQVLSIIGKPGSGKTVLSTVISDYVQHPAGGPRYTSILAPISQYLCSIFFPLYVLTIFVRWPDSHPHDPERRGQGDVVPNVYKAPWKRAAVSGSGRCLQPEPAYLRR